MGKLYNARKDPKVLEYQSDEKFQSWLRMQDAAMDIEFSIFDVPEVNGHMYTREGLVVAERALLERFPDYRTAFSGENQKLAMRFVYFIGETFRRATEGKWFALPPDPPKRGPQPLIDTEFSPILYNPMHLISFAFQRRTGKEIVTPYDYAVKDHQKWVEAGRPPRRD
ncbi:hypothetical protein [Nocardia amikacinitolerans]|uniref:hypothetical protein n=1 Tax=Nocardia amikacinitolerans TaxID=756689 RepID=UPI0020A3B8DD|nr:hypothetical protein [Nocardia amikacinitolerans]MCP2290042.1 hypothetical protein [Nocardia amikacinitolerans]